MSNAALEAIAKAALEGIQADARALGADVADSIKDALSDAAKHGLALLEATVSGSITGAELKAALNEIKETIEGVIAGDVFDAQRDVLNILKDTAITVLPKLAGAV